MVADPASTSFSVAQLLPFGWCMRKLGWTDEPLVEIRLIEGGTRDADQPEREWISIEVENIGARRRGHERGKISPARDAHVSVRTNGELVEHSWTGDPIPQMVVDLHRGRPVRVPLFMRFSTNGRHGYHPQNYTNGICYIADVEVTMRHTRHARELSPGQHLIEVAIAHSGRKPIVETIWVDVPASESEPIVLRKQ